MIELYGSVITGFEVVAQEEAASKLQVDCSRGRGFVRIPIDAQNIPEVLGLRSLDNVYAILYDYEIQGLRTADQKDAMELIRNEISRINWKTAVECWEIAHKKSVPGGVECVKVGDVYFASRPFH
ncbi:unnamed protein product [Nippostrongylus brasiliensis]|uniref:Phosphoribosylaminoimidazolesuccinocarboxamide synthase n=1 Tax=Nippostrongylus brasiliensis TaxID=27835 RepID=A0A0N4XJV5_NIPBR|nr:unnamed protein product [Nippostrongylus brasiliensis]